MHNLINLWKTIYTRAKIKDTINTGRKIYFIKGEKPRVRGTKRYLDLFKE